MMVKRGHIDLSFLLGAAVRTFMGMAWRMDRFPLSARIPQNAGCTKQGRVIVFRLLLRPSGGEKRRHCAN
jgi:hypothetical protein